VLNIFLGYACNFRCAYCLQDPKSGDSERRRHPVEDFVDRVVPDVKAKGITEVAYWGGEPLLYWEAIEAIHVALIAADVPLTFVSWSQTAACSRIGTSKPSIAGAPMWW